MTFLDLLELRLRAVLESPTDLRFYQNIHAYIDLIMKDEKGRVLIEQAERAYGVSHSSIWRQHHEDDELVDEQARQTYKFERFNLYSDKFVGLYVRIYLPIEDYISSDEPISKSHPGALLMLYGIKSPVLDHWAKHRPTVPYKDAKKQLKVNNRWYEEERGGYSNDLKQFHVDFITAYLKPDSDRIDISNMEIEIKSPIQFDYKTGDYSYQEAGGTLNPTSQEYKVLTTLLTNPGFQATYSELIKSYRPWVSEASKPEKGDLYKRINNLKNKLEVSEDQELIVNVKNIGYRLIGSQKKENTD